MQFLSIAVSSFESIMYFPLKSLPHLTFTRINMFTLKKFFYSRDWLDFSKCICLIFHPLIQSSNIQILPSPPHTIFSLNLLTSSNYFHTYHLIPNCLLHISFSSYNDIWINLKHRNKHFEVFIAKDHCPHVSRVSEGRGFMPH